VYSPVAAMSKAKERIAQKSAEASEESGEEIDYLEKALTLTRSDDEETQELGRQLLDTMGEFSSPSLRGIPAPELKYASTKNPDKAGTIQNRIPGDITDDSELAKREFFGDSYDIRDEIANTVSNAIYKPFIDKLQLDDLNVFLSTPEFQESIRTFQDQYLDAVAGEEAYGIGFDTSGDRFPGQGEEMDDIYDIMRFSFPESTIENASGEFTLFDILEDVRRHFNTHGIQYFNLASQSYDYDPKKYNISSQYGMYMFRELVRFFEHVKEEIEDRFAMARDELFDEGIVSYQMDDRFIVFNPDAYDNSRFDR
jgi:hypothetical protein